MYNFLNFVIETLTYLKNNDFKAIHVFNYLISIQSPLKQAQVDVSMIKSNKLYILT